MTTLTTVLGMVPMWLSTAEGMELQKGMAVVIIFGLTLSTLVTLVFIPVLYVLVEKMNPRGAAEVRRERRANKKRKKTENH